MTPKGGLNRGHDGGIKEESGKRNGRGREWQEKRKKNEVEKNRAEEMS